MSEGYIEASVEDPKSGAKISVIQSPRKTTRIVQFDNWIEQEACSDFLADIIARGIRSLEEEHGELLERGKKPRAERCDEDSPEDPDWGWPSHDAS